jgi:hypothetical protein
MLKVLSTKLESDEIDRFEEKAQHEGESKSGLLRRLALGYQRCPKQTIYSRHQDVQIISKKPKKIFKPGEIH